jgi:hypothetical protein
MTDMTFFERNRLEKRGIVKIDPLPENEFFDAKKHFLERMVPRGHGYGFPWPSANRHHYFSLSTLYDVSPISHIPEMYFNIFELKFDPSMNHCTVGLDMEEIVPNLDIGFLNEKEIWYIIAELTKKQLKGEKGDLVVNSCTNVIGRILCKDHIIRFVGIHWIPAYSEWRISSCTGVDRSGQVLQVIK